MQRLPIGETARMDPHLRIVFAQLPAGCMSCHKAGMQPCPVENRRVRSGKRAADPVAQVGNQVDSKFHDPLHSPNKVKIR